MGKFVDRGAAAVNRRARSARHAGKNGERGGGCGATGKETEIGARDLWIICSVVVIRKGGEK